MCSIPTDTLLLQLLGDGNLCPRRRKCEPEEMAKWAEEKEIWAEEMAKWARGDGNVRLRRRKYEDKEKEIWGVKNRRFAAA